MDETVIDRFNEALRVLCMDYGVDLDGYAKMQITEDLSTEFEVTVR